MIPRTPLAVSFFNDCSNNKMQRIRVLQIWLTLYLAGCVYQHGSSPSEIAKDLAVHYKRLTWAENRDGEVLLNNTWSVVINDGQAFWNDYTSLAKSVGAKEARQILEAIIKGEGLSLALVLAPGTRHLDDRDVQALLAGGHRHSKYLIVKLGNPPDWQKVDALRHIPKAFQGELP